MNAQDIGLMNETLDSMLVLDLDEENINKLYEQFLKTSFEQVQKILESHEKLNLQGDNLLYIRALYEHAIEKWSYDNFDGAKDLIFVLANIIQDEELEKALNVLIIFLSSKIQLEELFQKHSGSVTKIAKDLGCSGAAVRRQIELKGLKK